MRSDFSVKQLLKRLWAIPSDLKSPARRGDAVRLLVCILCVAVIIAGGLYTVSWTLNRRRIELESQSYSDMYTPTETQAPSPEPIATPTAFPTVVPAATPSPAPTSLPTPEPTSEPAPTATMPLVSDFPIPTPDSETLIFALETPPPVQESFAELLAHNPETVGFLKIGSIVSLPVVQRLYNNDYYLSHTFSHEESSEGALFLDGYNLLIPEDDCLIVYGHNMNNGAMFGNLRMYLNIDYFRGSSPVSFDTIYENQRYVPFAAFNASMDPDSGDYFNVRRFLFDPAGFDQFVSELKKRSVHYVPMDVQYGDRLLLLVTCDYSNDDGRFVLALREMRSDETDLSISELLSRALPQ